MVVNSKHRAFQRICIVELLDHFVVLILKTKANRVSSRGVIDTDSIAKVRLRSSEGYILERRKCANEGRPKEKTEFEEVLLSV